MIIDGWIALLSSPPPVENGAGCGRAADRARQVIRLLLWRQRRIVFPA